MSTKFRGAGWDARLHIHESFGDVGVLVSRAGTAEPSEALKCTLIEDAQANLDDRASGRCYRLSDGLNVVGRWYRSSGVLVLDLRAFASARRERGSNGLSFQEYSGEVTLQAS